MKLILLGPPGAGKGTQAEVLSRDLHIPTISTGNILRAAVMAGTPIGQKAKSFMDTGKLVPDEVIIGIINERLQEADCAKGYILDGVPRTIAQAEALEAAGIIFDHVLSLEIEDEAIVERMSGRWVCSLCGTPFHTETRPPKKNGSCDACGGALIQRDDDKPETVRHRLEVYHGETEPLKKFYEQRGVLARAPGNLGTIGETTQVIKQALGALV